MVVQDRLRARINLEHAIKGQALCPFIGCTHLFYLISQQLAGDIFRWRKIRHVIPPKLSPREIYARSNKHSSARPASRHRRIWPKTSSASVGVSDRVGSSKIKNRLPSKADLMILKLCFAWKAVHRTVERNAEGQSP